MNNKLSAPLFGIAFLTLLVFGILHWTNLSTGQYFDWLIGVALFWWLLLITIVPWNLHFKAKEIITDASDSQHAGIEVEERDVLYAKKISRNYLFVAIALHLTTTVGLYFLATSGLSAIGYLGALMALLLTFLRPSIRLYEYLNYRLSQMKSRIKYPREDILKVQNNLVILEDKIAELSDILDDENQLSWLNKQELAITMLKNDVSAIRQEFGTLTIDTKNQQLEILNQTENKISLLSEDAKLLNQVRELVRFIKEA